MPPIFKLLLKLWAKLEIKSKESLKFYKKSQIKLLILFFNVKRPKANHNANNLLKAIFNDVYIHKLIQFDNFNIICT